MADEKLSSLLEEKLAGAFAKLLPEEVARFIPVECWRESIKLSVYNFFEKRDPSYTERPSRFDRVIWGILQEETKKQLVDYFASPEWTARWGSDLSSINTATKEGCVMSKPFPGFSQMASDAVRELVKSNMESIITTLVGGQIQSIVDNMRYQIQRDLKQ